VAMSAGSEVVTPVVMGYSTVLSSCLRAGPCLVYSSILEEGSEVFFRNVLTTALPRALFVVT
jgi:hypothetical protein